MSDRLLKHQQLCGLFLHCCIWEACSGNKWLVQLSYWVVNLINQLIGYLIHDCARQRLVSMIFKKECNWTNGHAGLSQQFERKCCCQRNISVFCSGFNFAVWGPALTFEPRPGIFSQRNWAGKSGDLHFKVSPGQKVSGALGWCVALAIMEPQEDAHSPLFASRCHSWQVDIGDRRRGSVGRYEWWRA